MNLSILKSQTAQRLRAHTARVSGAGLFLAVIAENALAQTGGGTGTGAAVSTRVTNVLTDFQGIIYGVGALILSAAFMYVGYGMAFGGKKWSDVANVAYGAVIAGAGVMIVGWLFS